jgi:hypothetical protein
MVTSKDDVFKQVKHLFRTSTNKMLSSSDIEIQSDLSVNIHVSIRLVHRVPEGRLPIKLHMVDGEVSGPWMELRTLNNFPDVCSTLDVSHNLITSLTHAPGYVREMDVKHNLISSLEHVSDTCEFVNVIRNPLTSLKGLPDTPSDDLEVHLTWTPDLPLLRLLNATQVSIVDNNSQPLRDLNQIMNKYTGKGKSFMLNCALELKQAGYVGNARW